MLRIGHRGAPGWPRKAENTIFSFRKALRGGANAIEFDVRRCKDEIIVLHDKTFERITGGVHTDEVRYLQYAHLYSLYNRYCSANGIGEKEVHIPLLSDVLKRFGDQCFLIIELKERGIGKDVFDMVRAEKLENRVIISASDFLEGDSHEKASLPWEELVPLAQEVAVAPLVTMRNVMYMGYQEIISRTKDMGAVAIHANKTISREKFLIQAQRNGLQMHVWTVNKEKEIAHLKKLGVDGIMSDFPERL
ncbi:MAG: glycerophosphodiester phosphodiesterase [Patescibacteria group bacterium]|nr:MAG: glycerophosphodiester phosphodiesterase [Patescibacteria group bacterium]